MPAGSDKSLTEDPESLSSDVELGDEFNFQNIKEAEHGQSSAESSWPMAHIGLIEVESSGDSEDEGNSGPLIHLGYIEIESSGKSEDEADLFLANTNMQSTWEARHYQAFSDVEAEGHDNPPAGWEGILDLSNMSDSDSDEFILAHRALSRSREVIDLTDAD